MSFKETYLALVDRSDNTKGWLNNHKFIYEYRHMLKQGKIKEVLEALKEIRVSDAWLDVLQGDWNAYSIAAESILIKADKVLEPEQVEKLKLALTTEIIL